MKSSRLILLKALFKSGDKARLNSFTAPDLTSINELVTPFQIDWDKYRAYARCVGWLNELEGYQSAHPCYLQVFALPLQLSLLLSPQSPFSAMGLVHIGNHITTFSGFDLDEVDTLTCRFEQVCEHRRGWQFDVAVEGRQQGEVTYRAVSTYLSRVKAPHTGADVQANDVSVSDITNSQGETIHLYAPNDIGRRYARVSGDYNPIHLFNSTAKLLGFHSAIAHGMWSLAYSYSRFCIAQPECAKRVAGQASIVTTAFKKPWFLPAEGRLVYHPREEGDYQLVLTDQASGAPVLETQIQLQEQAAPSH